MAGGPANLPDWWEMHAEEGYMDALRGEEIFYGDLDPATGAAYAERLLHQSVAVGLHPLEQAAWHDLPSSYVVCDRDPAFPSEVQAMMAGRLQRTHHMDSGHSPFLSRPAELAELIRDEVALFLSGGKELRG